MILVTGGAGYIGSHTCVALLNAGKEVVVFDNFANSSRTSLERVQQICERPLTVVEGDIRDQAGVEKVLSDFGCTAVIHFAGLKSVLDSVTSPLDYYDNNVVGTHRLLRAMQASRVRRIIFSSDRGNESDVLSAPPRAPETGAGRWRPLWGHPVAD